MARGLSCAIERRDTTRVAPEHTPWRRVALLRPGLDIVLINLSAGGALVESRNRMTPGARTDLQLTGASRRVVGGRIERCRVTGLEPLRYEGAIVFDERLEWRATGSG